MQTSTLITVLAVAAAAFCLVIALLGGLVHAYAHEAASFRAAAGLEASSRPLCALPHPLPAPLGPEAAAGAGAAEHIAHAERARAALATRGDFGAAAAECAAALGAAPGDCGALVFAVAAAARGGGGGAPPAATAELAAAAECVRAVGDAPPGSPAAAVLAAAAGRAALRAAELCRAEGCRIDKASAALEYVARFAAASRALGDAAARAAEGRVWRARADADTSGAPGAGVPLLELAALESGSARECAALLGFAAGAPRAALGGEREAAAGDAGRALGIAARVAADIAAGIEDRPGPAELRSADPRGDAADALNIARHFGREGARLELERQLRSCALHLERAGLAARDGAPGAPRRDVWAELAAAVRRRAEAAIVITEDTGSDAAGDGRGSGGATAAETE